MVADVPERRLSVVQCRIRDVRRDARYVYAGHAYGHLSCRKT